MNKIYFLIVFFANLIQAKINLDSFLIPVKKSPVPQKIQSISPSKPSLQNFLIKQANPDYQSALKILSDPHMKSSYHADLVSIELFFEYYSSKVLQNYSVPKATKTQKSPLTLTAFLHKVTPATTTTTITTNHPTLDQLSDLANLVQKNTTVTKSTTTHVVKKSINLDSFLQKSSGAKSTVTVKKSSANLLNFLIPKK